MHIKKQQNSLKRMLAVEKPNDCPTPKLQMKNDQPTIAQAFSNEYLFLILRIYLAQLDENGEKTNLITKRISQMICVDLLPFSSVERPGFKKLMDELAPRYKLKYYSSIHILSIYC